MTEEQEHQLLLPLVEDENICLPLPINVVSRYWNIELPMAEAVESAKKYSDFNGSIMIEGIELAERHGLSSKIVHSSLTELKKIIDAGIPPIVILPGIPELLQGGGPTSPSNHQQLSLPMRDNAQIQGGPRRVLLWSVTGNASWANVLLLFDPFEHHEEGIFHGGFTKSLEST